MLKLIKKYYSEVNAVDYDRKRKRNPKWKFEDETLRATLADKKSEIEKVVDYPVGTGRAFDEFFRYPALKITGVDYSIDMIDVAKEKDKHGRVSFCQQDVFNPDRYFSADLVVSYRFLNLFEWSLAGKALANLISYSNNFILFSIRTVDDNYAGSLLIEDKIYLHRESDVLDVLKGSGFNVVKSFEFADEREGDYKILLCQKQKRVLSSRFSKSGRYVYTYGSDQVSGKVYEVENNLHANFIQSVCERPMIEKYFPKINKIEGGFLDVEWVEGEILTARNWNDVPDILVSIQELENDDASSFDYVEDKVLPRFFKSVPLLGIDFCNEVVDLIKNGSLEYSRKVSHPDLVPGNILKTQNGLIVIDNELLCYSLYHRIDILNILHNLPEAEREPVVNSYLLKSGLNMNKLVQEKEFLSSLWLARQVGSLLYYGKLREIYEMVARYKSKENILPIDFLN